MKVLKFGGTSVGSREALLCVKDIVGRAWQHERALVVVVSAFSGVTDELINLAHKAEQQYGCETLELESRHYNIINVLINIEYRQLVYDYIHERFEELNSLLRGIYLLKELSSRTLDLVASFGERLSAYILTYVLKSADIPALYCDARTLIKTDARFGSACVDRVISYGNIQRYLQECSEIPVVTGFIGSTILNETTTLGRGGSDYTASLIGAAVHAQSIEIWTDVDGVMTADPRRVSFALCIPSMTYDEAMEMSYFGAKVIYPPTIQPACEAHIPLIIKNTFNSTHPGTLIAHHVPSYQALIRGISSIRDVALIEVQGVGIVGVSGFLQRLCGALACENINIILITQASSEHSICCAIDLLNMERARTALEVEFARELREHLLQPIHIEQDLSIIAIVGGCMRKKHGISGTLFQALGSQAINVRAIAQGSTELNISVVIDNKDQERALNAVHEAFFYSHESTVLIVAGTGVVGGALLDMIQTHASHLNIVGIFNENHMLVTTEKSKKIALDSWRSDLEKAPLGSFPLLKEFIQQYAHKQLIFVDCTGSQVVVDWYEDLIKSGISLVTSSKLANTQASDRYHHIHTLVQEAGVSFRYSTNVGAGLPVISTLRMLRKTGDTVKKIEAVLSGTMSYLFNTFDGKKKFSDLVREAQELGYTEPDPRDDLCGKDVARKLLILARELGYTLELDDIVVESLVPVRCKPGSGVQEFYACLSDADAIFDVRLREAHAAGKRLRYTATLIGSTGWVGLEAVDTQHPAYGLVGCDNIVAFTTERYSNTPLVIKGPGAGGVVTAAGVLADTAPLVYLKQKEEPQFRLTPVS